MMKTTGILRKSNYQQHHEPAPDLLVFGYQSKLYRDDVKALEIDRLTHLIPAPYEQKDLISRYDVRATLETAPAEPQDSYMNRMQSLPPAEQQAEVMAEKERYYSLYVNEVEEELYKEELLKREKANHHEIAFNYNEIGPKESAAVSPDPEENDTTPFTPSVRLDLPVDMEIPTTLKLNQIIEKTAKFISSQGTQMEILLKTKQASNPQFNFLNHDGQYNSYYKHIMAMMRAGNYPWEDTIDKSEENSQDSEDTKETNGTSSLPAPLNAIVIPKMIFKPSADCAYTQLISRITKAPISEIEKQVKLDNQQHENGNASATVAVVNKPSGLVGLVHYSSDSESEEEIETPPTLVYSGILPPSELQLVIDKTALYVAKNGTDFEETLRKKQDARFQFLELTNEFHEYYMFKVNEGRITHNLLPVITTKPSVDEAKPKEEEKVPKPPAAPVCFSIKAKEEKPQLKTPILLIASSDDETKMPATPDPPKIVSLVEEELERQVDAMNSEREEKLAKERLNDKLVNAAREKLGMLPKEKILQIERKKKALMFINQIKGEIFSNTNGQPFGNSLANGVEEADKEDEIINLTHYGDDSDDSVKSIPMTTSPAHVVSRRSRSRKRSSSSHRTSYSSSSTSSHSRSPERRPKRSKSKKSKSKRSKKSYRRKTRSRSRSPSRKRHRRDRRH